jgi:hypothetical protein
MKQVSLSMTGYFDKGKKTKREQFLTEMDQVVPWARLCALIESRITRRQVRPVVARRCPLSACCAFTACSSGTTFPIRVRRKRSMTRSRCASSRA